LGVGGRKRKKERKRKRKKVWGEHQRIYIRRSIKKVAWNYLFQLTHEDAAGVSCFAAVEGEQQIQSWEVKDINLWAATWASACDNICNAIAIAIVDCNANATGKGFCVGHELGK
jgi:hypothetical protein